MKFGPRQHAPTGRNRNSAGLTVRETHALAETLRRSMLADRADPDGIDSFAHSALHGLEQTLDRIETPPGPSARSPAPA